MTTRPGSFTSWFVTAGLTLLLAAFFIAGPAQAQSASDDAASVYGGAFGREMDPLFCKDCPFPMKVGDGRYLMPNGALYVEIKEVALRGRMREVTIVLRHAQTGEIIAKGADQMRVNRKNAVIKLIDNNGETVWAEISWANKNREEIQLRLSCDRCSISSLFN